MINLVGGRRARTRRTNTASPRLFQAQCDSGIFALGLLLALRALPVYPMDALGRSYAGGATGRLAGWEWRDGIAAGRGAVPAPGNMYRTEYV